jgi:tetratricopeptide (TPR) repeat protein
MRIHLLTTIVAFGVALAATSAVAGDNVIHMMTLPTDVRGTLEIETGEIERGIAKSLTAVESPRPSIRSAALANLCIGYAKQGEYAMALEYCDKGVDEGRYTWMALINRGAVHYLLGNYTSSVTDLRRARDIRSTAMEAKNNLARAERSYASLGGNQNLAQNPAN